jgi:hypothetical protein
MSSRAAKRTAFLGTRPFELPRRPKAGPGDTAADRLQLRQAELRAREQQAEHPLPPFEEFEPSQSQRHIQEPHDDVDELTHHHGVEGIEYDSERQMVVSPQQVGDDMDIDTGVSGASSDKQEHGSIESEVETEDGARK